MEGLPYEAIRDFVGPEVAARFTSDQLHDLWRKAEGNPYLIRILTKVDFAPDRDKDLNQWFDSLLDTLSGEARQLVYSLSVIRGEFNLSLMRSLAQSDEQ